MVALSITLDGTTEWEVEHIVRYRILYRNKQLLVLCVEFDISKAIQLFENNWGNAQQFLMQYKQSHGLL